LWHDRYIGLRLSTATAVIDCAMLKLWSSEMVCFMRGACIFSKLFIRYLIKRNMRVQADLFGQLFNSSEKRVAHILPMMAEYGEHGKR
jgi:hypothetical protein